MKTHTSMDEGPQAFENFKRAVKMILSVPKTALPPDPFSKPKPQTKKPVSAKA